MDLLKEQQNNFLHITIIGPEASHDNDNIFVKALPVKNQVIPTDLLLISLSRTKGMSKDKLCQTYHTDVIQNCLI